MYYLSCGLIVLLKLIAETRPVTWSIQESNLGMIERKLFFRHTCEINVRTFVCAIIFNCICNTCTWLLLLGPGCLCSLVPGGILPGDRAKGRGDIRGGE